MSESTSHLTPHLLIIPAPCHSNAKHVMTKTRPAKAAVSAVLAILSFLMPEGAYAFAPNTINSVGLVQLVATPTVRPSKLFAVTTNDDDGNEGSAADWRAFRAKLVQNGLPSLTTLAGDKEESEKSKQQDHYAYETTPLVEVGTILLSIPTTDLCQALEQQYWHRAVVLITAVSEDKINGEVETVPEEQLAQGAGRGRWSYRGVLLNRPTDLVFDGATGEQMYGENNEHEDEWNVLRGGDLAGIDSFDGETEFLCVHNLPPDADLDSASTPLVGDLSMISLDDARRLCDDNPTKYRSRDFLTFGGFCSWRPQQLEREMDDNRGEWLALSVDPESILNQIKMQHDACFTETISAHDRLKAGTAMWRNFLDLVQRSEAQATERLPAGQLKFYDAMLRIWAEENLSVGGSNDGDDGSNHGSSSKSDAKPKDSSGLIGPGTLVRATTRVPNSVLLYDQEFIRSLILVLEETKDATIGVTLGLPLSAAVECVEDAPPMLLRYSGPIDAATWRDGTYLENEEDDFESGSTEDDNEMYEGFIDYMYQSAEVTVEYSEGEDSDTAYVYYDENGDDDDDSSFIWLHRDDALGSRGASNGGGTPLGSSGIYMIKESDALEALQSGLLSQKDTMVFQGVCIWEKAEDLGQCGGGLREQIDALDAMEVIQAHNNENDDILESVWDILNQKQDVLVQETLDANIAAGIEAWEACNGETEGDEELKQVTEETGLSDAALRAWIGVNLLGKPLDTLVELKTSSCRNQQKNVDME